MIELIPKSFLQRLDSYVVKEKEDGTCLFELPPFYAKLFEHKNSNSMRKSNTGWQMSELGNKMYAHLNNLSSEDVAIIEKFISDFKQLIVIGINDNIKQYFTNELDWCIALDYNFENGARTIIGELEYQAKYLKSNVSKEKLIDQLSKNVSNSLLNNSDEVPILMYVPSTKSDPWPLTKLLAEGIRANSISKNLLSENNPIIHSVIHGEKGKMKNASIDEKIRIWQNLIDSDRIELVDSVAGENIIVIDDLYQSGTTLWSFAKFLKTKGARSVHGLVCVKSMSDTDNK